MLSREKLTAMISYAERDLLSGTDSEVRAYSYTGWVVLAILTLNALIHSKHGFNKRLLKRSYVLPQARMMFLFFFSTTTSSRFSDVASEVKPGSPFSPRQLADS